MFGYKPAPKLSKNVNKDVVLCETTNHVASKYTTSLLMDNAIPFSSNWKRVSILKRNIYHGADKVCIISINRNDYSRARRCIRMLEPRHFERLTVNVI